MGSTQSRNKKPRLSKEKKHFIAYPRGAEKWKSSIRPRLSRKRKMRIDEVQSDALPDFAPKYVAKFLGRQELRNLALVNKQINKIASGELRFRRPIKIEGRESRILREVKQTKIGSQFQGSLTILGIFDRDEVNKILRLFPNATGLVLSPVAAPELWTDKVNPSELKPTNIDRLPEAILEMKKLRNLEVNFPLKSLPDNIGSISRLETLSLRNYYIEKMKPGLSTLPESIGNLQNLKELGLESQSITSLPHSMIRMTSLKKVYLGLNNHDGVELPKGMYDLLIKLESDKGVKWIDYEEPPLDSEDDEEMSDE